MKEDKNDQEFSRRITFRLTDKEWKRLGKILRRSRHQSISELIRTMLFKGKVTITVRDNSLDIAMEKLSSISTDLRRIGTNINQIVRKFHNEKLPENKLILTLEVGKQYQEVGEKVDELLGVIKELSLKWLPE